MSDVIEVKEVVARDAFEEALRRFPDAHGALIFLWGASGLGFRNPAPEELERAAKRWGGHFEQFAPLPSPSTPHSGG